MFNREETQAFKKFDRLGGDAAKPDEIVDGDRDFCEFSDGQHRTDQGNRRNDRIDAGSVREAGIDVQLSRWQSDETIAQVGDVSQS